jgi:predicted nucleic acid-binding protein
MPNFKNSHLFLLSLTVSLFSLNMAGVLEADDPEKKQELAALSQKAMIDNCEITGKLIQRKDGLYAVLEIKNPTEEKIAVDFNAAVSSLNNLSMGRMMPTPQIAKENFVKLDVLAGATVQHEFLVKKTPKAKPVIKSASKTEAKAKAVLNNIQIINWSNTANFAPITWSLMVSKEKVKIPAWGTALPLEQKRVNNNKTNIEKPVVKKIIAPVLLTSTVSKDDKEVKTKS